MSRDGSLVAEWPKYGGFWFEDMGIGSCVCCLEDEHVLEDSGYFLFSLIIIDERGEELCP